MAQVIKLKRSAVAGKTPQTSSLELGELGINTSDGKIYFHRSSSSDDSIQSVLTTDATITGSLKLSGSQHISGSTNVMDDLTYGGNLSASIGSTSSFDRFTSLGTSSIGFLIASGSNFATFTDQTGSFASGSDVQGILDTYASGSDFHQILAESSSYLINADTASLGKVTLVSDITGSITSTASFGKIFGDGSDLENVADPTAISGSFQGGGSNSFSGSLISTASFGKLELVDVTGLPFASGSDVQTIKDTYASGSDVQTIKDTYASGSDFHQILAESSSYLVNADTASLGKVTLVSDITGSITSTASFGLFVGDGAGLTNVTTDTSAFASGSDLHQILAESSSYVVESETGSFASGSDVQGILDTYASGSDLQVILAESASYLNNDTTSSFGAVSMNSTLFVQGDITTSGSVVAQQFRTEFVSESIIFASGSTQFGDSSDDKHRYTGSIEITGNISSSFTSTGSFGNLKLADFGGLPFASGSDLHQILAESSSYVVESETGSFASGSDVQGILDDYAKGTEISGSFNQGFEFTGTISGSITSTASFGKIFGDGSDLENVADPAAISGSFQGGGSNSFSGSLISTASFGTLELVNSHGFVLSTETGSFASGSDLQIIQAESASYVVSTNTGSFASGSDVQTIKDTYASGSDLQVILAESASYVVSTNTGSFLQNSDTASLQSTIITSSLEITGSQTFEGTDNFINFKSEYSGSKITKWEMGKNSDDDFKINRYGGSGSFLDQPISIASSSGITTIKDQLTKSSGVTRLIAGGSTQDGVSVYNDKKVGIGTGTTAIGDEKFLVAGDTGITGSLFVSSSITTPTTGSFGRVVTTNLDADGGVTIDNITIDGTEIDLSSGDLTIDVAGDIDLDAGGQQIKFSTGGTAVGQIDMAGTDLEIKSLVSNATFTLRGNDGGSEIDMLAFDVAGGGKAKFISDVSASLGGTGSFDRLEGNTLNATISPFASGSDVSQIQAQTGSYATGSDLHQFLAESASYLVDADTGSLGLLTLGNNITGSITSTGSFGRINAADKVFVDGRLGIGTELPAREFNVVSTQQVTSEFTSTNAIGNLIDLVHENSANGHNGFRFFDEGTQRMGLLHVQNGTRGYIHISNTYVSGSEIVAVDGDNQNVIIGNHASKDEKLFVDGNVGMTGDLNVSGSITANEYIVNSSVTNVTQSFSSGSTIFGDSIDDTHKFTGSLSVSGGLSFPLSGSTITFDGEDGNTQIAAPNDTQLQLKVKGVQGINVFNSGVVINEGSQDYNFRVETNNDSRTIFADGGRDNVSIGYNTAAFDEKFLVAGDVGVTGSLHTSGSITTQANISGSITSTGSFGHIALQDNLRISEESDDVIIQTITQDKDLKIKVNDSGSIIDAISIDSSDAGSATFSHDIKVNDGGKLKAGSGNDLLIIHDGADSYIENNTRHLYIKNTADDSDILFQSDDDSGGVKTYLQLDGSEGNVRIPDSVEFNLGNSQDFRILHDGSNSQIKNYTGTLFISNLGTNGDIIFQVDQGGVDNRIMVLDGSREAVAIGKRTDGGTLDPGDDKLLVAGDVGVTGSLFVSSSITTPELINNTGTLKVSQSVSDGDIEISVNDGGTTKKALTIDGSDAGSVILGNNLRMQDNQKIRLGTSNDFNLYHDGSHSYIHNDGTGDIIIENLNDDRDIIFKTDDGSGGRTAYLTLDGSATNIKVSKTIKLYDGVNLSIGDSDDLILKHDGINTKITNSTGDLIVSQSAQDKDFAISINDGGTTKTAFFIDGATGYVGIGETSLVKQFQVNGTVTITNNGGYTQRDNVGNIATILNLNSSNLLTVGDNNHADNLKIQNSSFNYIYFNSSGNIGVGTSSPSQRLHVFDTGSNLQFYLQSGADQSTIRYENDTASYVVGINSSEQYQWYSSALGQNAGFIASNGNLYWNYTFLLSNNNKFIQGRDTAGQTRNMLGMNSANNIQLGDSNHTGSMIVNTPLLSGSIETTASFGRIEADTYSLATLSEVSGGLSSTGSFGQLFLAGITGSSNSNALTIEHGRLVISSSIPEISFVDRDGTNISNGIQNYNGSMRLFTDTQAGHGGSNINFRIDGAGDSKEVARFTNKGLIINVGSQGGSLGDENFLVNGDAGITGSLTISGSLLPGADNTTDIGSASKRFQDVFAVQTTVGAVFETGLRSKGIGKEETGTIVVWRNGKLVPCDTSEDTMVMGVVKQGKDEPIVMGAEPVLVTGDVKEGDFITTSTKLGHGKKIESGYLLKKEMFGKVIAQALENATGNSSLIKCMIRKM